MKKQKRIYNIIFWVKRKTIKHLHWVNFKLKKVCKKKKLTPSFDMHNQMFANFNKYGKEHKQYYETLHLFLFKN